MRYRVYKPFFEVFADLPLVTSNDLWPPPKIIGFFLSTWRIHIPNMKSVGHSYLEISRLQAIFGVFAVLPLVTSNDLWPPPKTIGFFLSTWQIHIPNMKSVSHSYLEISWLQSFRFLTSGDLRWPLTSTKNNRVLPLNMTNLYTKYEKCRLSLSQDFVFTRFSVFDLKWPLTPTKNNRVLPLNMTNLYTTYEKCQSFLS